MGLCAGPSPHRTAPSRTRRAGGARPGRAASLLNFELTQLGGQRREGSRPRGDRGPVARGAARRPLGAERPGRSAPGARPRGTWAPRARGAQSARCCRPHRGGEGWRPPGKRLGLGSARPAGPPATSSTAGFAQPAGSPEGPNLCPFPRHRPPSGCPIQRACRAPRSLLATLSGRLGGSRRAGRTARGVTPLPRGPRLRGTH